MAVSDGQIQAETPVAKAIHEVTLARGMAPVTVMAMDRSNKPVYAAAVTLPAESIYQAHGLAAGTPVQLVRDSGEPVPVLSGIEDRGFSPTSNPSAYYTSEGKLTPSFDRFIAPFIRGVLRHNMVPSKEQLREQIRLAVYNDCAELKKEHDPYYYEWEALYRGTYGFRDVGIYPGTLMEYFPNSRRYHYIPVFAQGKTELKGIQTLPLSQLQDATKVRSLFDAAYPQWYEGNALVQLVGDTLTVMNSNENTDEKQTHAVALKNRGILLNVGGTTEQHSYVMGKFEEGNKRLWLQANREYTERPTELRILCRKKPDVKIIPETVALVNQWGARTQTLRLTLDHTDCAVELKLN